MLRLSSHHFRNQSCDVYKLFSLSLIGTSVGGVPADRPSLEAAQLEIEQHNSTEGSSPASLTQRSGRDTMTSSFRHNVLCGVPG